jgi:alpha-amylase
MALSGSWAQAPRPLGPPAERFAHGPEVGVYYQIFVRSFFDSDGDGIGDLEGIRQRLPYLSELGVQGIWLTPIHPASSYHGYDVLDYWRLDPALGTLSDLHRLLDDAHARGMRVLMDLVVNHTSSQHPDFLRALAGNPEARARYRFASAPAATIGTLGGPAWHRASDGSYYYGVFTGGMPDLDHENPHVFEEMVAIARYWLDQGFDGFRIDAIQHVVEGRDGAIANAPENFAWVQRFGAAVRERHPGAFLLGETWTNTPTIASYHRDGALDMSVDYPLFLALTNALQGRNASDVRLQLRNTADLLPAGAWIATFTSNHDQLRPATVLSPLRRNPLREALLGRLLLALPGIPFIYYGEEIGMPNGPGLDDRQKRTPMRWEATPAGGFSPTTPWFPPATTDPAVSVAAQRTDPDSTWNAYRAAIALRNAEPALARGDVEVLGTTGGLLALWRRVPDAGAAEVLVLANLAAGAVTVAFEALGIDTPLEALTPDTGPAGTLQTSLTLPGNTLYLLTRARNAEGAR